MNVIAVLHEAFEYVPSDESGRRSQEYCHDGEIVYPSGSYESLEFEGEHPRVGGYPPISGCA